MGERQAIVTVSRADKKFFAAMMLLQTSILTLAISISGAWYSEFINRSVEHKLKIKGTLNRLESDLALQRQKEKYKAQGISTEDIN